MGKEHRPEKKQASFLNPWHKKLGENVRRGTEYTGKKRVNHSLGERERERERRKQGINHRCTLAKHAQYNSMMWYQLLEHFFVPSAQLKWKGNIGEIVENPPIHSLNPHQSDTVDKSGNAFYGNMTKELEWELLWRICMNTTGKNRVRERERERCT